MLLDTCALLWLSQGGERIPKPVLKKISAAPTLSISAITGFEISLKHQQGRLELPASPDEWLAIVLKQHDVAVLPLTLPITIRAATLPAYHKDPCDRFIIATAELHHLPIVTADPAFAQYPVTILW